MRQEGKSLVKQALILFTFLMVSSAFDKYQRQTKKRRLLRSEKSATFFPNFRQLKKDSLKLSSKIKLIVLRS